MADRQNPERTPRKDPVSVQVPIMSPLSDTSSDSESSNEISNTEIAHAQPTNKRVQGSNQHEYVIISGTFLLDSWATLSEENISQEIKRFLQLNIRFEGYVQAEYVRSIDELITALKVKTPRSATKMQKIFDKWCQPFWKETFADLFHRLINQKMDDILDAGLLEEWWDSALVFLFNSYQVIDKHSNQAGAQEVIKKHYLLWLQAVEAVRRKYYKGSLRDDLVHNPHHQKHFLDGTRYMKFVGLRPFWSDFTSEVNRRASSLDPPKLDAKLQLDIEFLMRDLDNHDSDPCLDVKMACNILKDIKAASGVQSMMSRRAIILQADHLLKEWAQSKNDNIAQLLLNTTKDLMQLDLDQLPLETSERLLTRCAELACRLHFMEGYFVNVAIVGHFEFAIQAHMHKLRGSKSSKRSRVARVWQLVWKILEKLHKNQHVLRPKAAIHGRHKTMDYNFLFQQCYLFDAIKDSEIYSGRLVHLIVAEYCDMVYAEFNADTDFHDSRELENLAKWERFLSSPLSPDEATVDRLHKELHYLVLALRRLALEIGVDLSMWAYNRAQERQSRTITQNLNFDPIPEHHIQLAYQALPLKLLADNQNLPNPSFSLVPAHLLGNEKLDVQEDEGLNMPLKQIKNPYRRFIPGNGQFLMAETAAIANAHGDRIEKSLNEPGIDESEVVENLSCEPQRTFDLKDDPQGIRDSFTSPRPSLRDVFWLRASLLKYFRRHGTVSSKSKLGFPSATEYEALRPFKRTIRNRSECFRPVCVTPSVQVVRLQEQLAAAKRRRERRAARAKVKANNISKAIEQGPVPTSESSAKAIPPFSSENTDPTTRAPATPEQNLDKLPRIRPQSQDSSRASTPNSRRMSTRRGQSPQIVRTEPNSSEMSGMDGSEAVRISPLVQPRTTFSMLPTPPSTARKDRK